LFKTRKEHTGHCPQNKAVGRTTTPQTCYCRDSGRREHWRNKCTTSVGYVLSTVCIHTRGSVSYLSIKITICRKHERSASTAPKMRERREGRGMGTVRGCHRASRCVLKTLPPAAQAAHSAPPPPPTPPPSTSHPVLVTTNVTSNTTPHYIFQYEHTTTTHRGVGTWIGLCDYVSVCRVCRGQYKRLQSRNTEFAKSPAPSLAPWRPRTPRSGPAKAPVSPYAALQSLHDRAVTVWMTIMCTKRRNRM
jgi:hypothetical protein